MQDSRCGKVGGCFGYYASLQTRACRESSSKILCPCNIGAAQLVDSALQGGALVAVLCNTSGFGPASGLSEAAVAALGPLAERVRVLQAGSTASVTTSFEGSLEAAKAQVRPRRVAQTWPRCCSVPSPRCLLAECAGRSGEEGMGMGVRQRQAGASRAKKSQRGLASML